MPGFVAGLLEAHGRYADRPHAELIAPAIGLADQGMTANVWLASHLAATDEPDALLPDGDELTAGELFTQPQLADTLAAIDDDGPEVVYDGSVADAIAEATGDLTVDDVAAYAVRHSEPLSVAWGGRTLHLSPPAGGVALAGVLLRVERYAAGAAPGTGEHAVPHMLAHLASEDDRLSYVADPAYVDVDTDELLKRARTDDPDDVDPATSSETGGTTHISVIDADGNAASTTNTVGTSFGAQIPTAAGFALGDQASDLAPPDVPPKPLRGRQAPPQLHQPADRHRRRRRRARRRQRRGRRIYGVLGQVLARRHAHGRLSDAIAAARLHPELAPMARG